MQLSIHYEWILIRKHSGTKLKKGYLSEILVLYQSAGKNKERLQVL